MVNELVRVAKTTTNPSRFLEESGDALRQAFTHIIVAQYSERKTEILNMIDQHFPEAKVKAMQHLLVREAH
jgi:hypothetical protein